LKRSSEYSVDGALRLLKEWQNEGMSGGIHAGAAEQKLYVDDFVPNKTFKNKAEFIGFLKHLVVLLQAEVKRLQEQNAFLEAELSRWDVTIFADTPCPDQFVLELPSDVAAQLSASSGLSAECLGTRDLNIDCGNHKPRMVMSWRRKWSWTHAIYLVSFPSIL
jgi:hypothetical protein